VTFLKILWKKSNLVDSHAKLCSTLHAKYILLSLVTWNHH